MKLNKIKIAMLSMISIGALGTSTLIANAEEGKSDGGYSVAPVSNSPLQDPDFPSYFRLNWKSGATGEIGLKIENKSDVDAVYNVSFNRGITNLNGATVYDESRFNESGPDPRIITMLDMPKEVKVKANSSEVVTGKFKMPKENFKGSRVGGVTVSQKTEKATDSVEMAFNYAYPFIVIGDNFEPVSKDITFGKFELIEDESTLYLRTPFDNKNATFFRLQELDVSLKDKSGKEVFGYNLPELLVTDSTNVPLSTQVTEALESGEYTATIQMKYNDEILASDEQTFTYEKTKGFDNSPTVRGTSADKENEGNDKMMIIGGVIILLLIIIVIVLIVKNKGKGNTPTPTEDTKQDKDETFSEKVNDGVVEGTVTTDVESTEDTIVEDDNREEIDTSDIEESEVGPAIVDETETLSEVNEVDMTPSEVANEEIIEVASNDEESTDDIDEVESVEENESK